MKLPEKQRLNLARRRADYEAMIAKGKANSEAYHKPGSAKKG